MIRKSALVLAGGLLSVLLVGAAPAKADDWGFSFRYGRHHYPRYYDCPPVYIYERPVYHHRYYSYDYYPRYYRSYRSYHRPYRYRDCW